MQFGRKTIERKGNLSGTDFPSTDQVELPAGKGQAQRDF